MSNAPERIIAQRGPNGYDCDSIWWMPTGAKEAPDFDETEYTRSDIAEKLRAEILRLRVAMAKAAQRADDWPGSNDDPACCLQDCADILYDALDYRHIATGEEDKT